MTKNEALDETTPVLHVHRIGDALGVILPEELLARLHIKEGDKLHVVEQTERGLKLSPYDPTHIRGMEIARQAFRDYADTFRSLAK